MFRHRLVLLSGYWRCSWSTSIVREHVTEQGLRKNANPEVWKSLDQPSESNHVYLREVLWLISWRAWLLALPGF